MTSRYSQRVASWRRRRAVILASALAAAWGAAHAQVPSRAQGATPQTAESKKGPRKPSQKSSAVPRTNLKPRLQPGDVIRYRVELQTTSQTTTHTGAVTDPQGPSQLVVTWDAVVRLEILGVPPSALGQSGSTEAAAGATPRPANGGALPAKAQGALPAMSQAMRIRTVYEKSAATVESDTPDPDAEGIQKQYTQLEGRSIEFTLGADGHISDVRGLEGVVSDDKAKNAAQQWLAQISGSSSAPTGSIVPGQSWSSDETAASMPLAGLVWRTDATYVRNESCHAANPAGSVGAADTVAAAGESCALILSRLTLVAAHARRDPTPDEYRRNGLHTSGHWTGSGESLSYVSLKNGWVVSVTQTGAEEMDVTIANGTQGVSMHYAGTIHTRSELSLLPAEPTAATSSPAPSASPQPR